MNAMKLWDMQNQQNAQRAPLNQMISDWMAQQPPQSPAGAPPQPPVALSAGPQPPMPVSNGPMIGGMQPASLPSNAQLPPPRPQGVPPYQTVNSMAPPPGQPSTPMPPDRGMPVAEMPPQQAIAQPFNMNMAPPGQSPQPQGQQQQPPSPMQMIQMLAKSGQPPEVQDALFNRMVPIWEITHKQDLEQLKAMLIPAQIQNTLALAGLHNVNAGAVPTKLNQSAKKETDLDTHRKAQEE